MTEAYKIQALKKTGVSGSVAKILRAKSGNMCAFPGCKNNLITPDGRLLGEICTIKSITASGPRGSAVADFSEYYSEKNLIYLCPTHHRLVDIEPEIYTVDFLLNIKLKHEKKISSPGTVILGNKIEIPEDLSLAEILDFWSKNQHQSSEEFWQVFFSNHPQIISLLFPNPIIKIGEKTYLGGKDIDNRGGNIADFIYQNAIAKSIVIVEIKTPVTPLLGQQYRGNVYAMSKDLSGGIVQVLNYKLEIQRDYHRLAYESKKDFEVIEPMCLLICGNLNDEILDGKQMRSFELFRNSLNNLIVLTYDELFEKIRMIYNFQ